jgi:hypothetical protein
MKKLEKTLKSCDAIDKHAGNQQPDIGIRESRNFDSVWQIADTLKGD